nr:LON peptidase substrate-binding domain-containing protein [Bacteroidota bacterium]
MSEILRNFPLFPISIIVFPGEIQPLHIFEKRYKQLIAEMEKNNGAFGIPFVKDGKLCEYGSGVVIHKILATSPTGEMDILVKGVNMFQIIDIVERLPEKLYGGGVVKLLNEMNHLVSNTLKRKFDKYKTQLAVLNKEKVPEQIPSFKNIFDIAGQLPLEIEEKYYLIKSENLLSREHLLSEKIDFLLMINKKLEEVGYKFYLN